MTIKHYPSTGFASAFAEWDRRYRANPAAFMTDVERLLGNVPETYGAFAAAYFTALLDRSEPNAAHDDRTGTAT